MKRKVYPIHPDFKKKTNINPPLNRALLPVMQKALSLLFRMEKTSAGLSVERINIRTTDGASVRALLYSPEGVSGRLPCVVYFHGGGFVMPAAPYHYSLAREYSLRAGCKVLFVDYRLAPGHPFPTPPEDCYSAYTRVLSTAEELSVDSSRIAVAGDSAGGALAAAVCLMSRDRGIAIPCAQLLIYPVTGRDYETGSMKEYTDTQMCNSKDIKKYDKYYIKNIDADMYAYCSPVHAESLSGLPPAYIETAEFDCLRDGGIQFAKRLRSFGVTAELYNTAGTVHGFDIVLDSPIVRECVDRRCKFLKDAFAKPDKPTP